MGRNLSNLYISSSYQFLTQISGSELQTGLGDKITGSLEITSSKADTATSASFASTAVSSSYALTASFALNASATVDTGSLLITASISNATTTFTKGDGSTFNLTVNNVVNANSASVATQATNAYTASLAITSSYALTATSASYAINANSALTATSASFASNALSASIANTATTASYVLNAVSSSFSTTALSASYSAAALSSSHAINANSALTATSASFATNATSASFASTIASGLNISASSINATSGSFQNLTAVSASFGYVKTVTGSAVIIGDEFIILNADTPVAPFAGIKVYDTGSAATASLEWNGVSDTWITVEENGDSAMILTGLSGSKGSEVAPALNKLLKGQGNNTVANSTITDNGTLVTIDNNVSASGFISSSQFVGNLQGTASFATSASFATTASFALNVPSINTSSLATTGSNTFIGNETISGSLNVSGSVTGNVLGNNTDTFTSSAAVQQVVSLTQTEYNGITPDANTLYIISGSTPINPSIYATTGSNTFVGNQIVTGSVNITGSNLTLAQGSNLVGHNINAAAVNGIEINNNTGNPVALFGAGGSQGTTFYGQLNTTAISASSFISASQFVGNITGTATSASFYDLSAVTQNAVFSGSVRGDVGALSISSNTASLDLSTGNFFTLTLVSGSNTYINPTNIQPGQTVNLRITQANPGNGTVSFPSSVKQVSGSIYTPTTGSGPVDIVTFISFDASSLYLSNVKNLV
jgi:hypothetical protein